MIYRHVFNALFALTLTIPAAVLAQEGDTTDLRPAGTVNWTLGDKAMAYTTNSSVYDTMRIGSVATYDLPADETHPAPFKVLDIAAYEAADGTGGSISLSVEFTVDPATDGVVSLSQYYPDTGNSPFWVNVPEGARPMTVKIDSFSFDGTSGKVTGSFEGDLCKVASWEAQPDVADCTPVSGSFDSEVYPGL